MSLPLESTKVHQRQLNTMQVNYSTIIAKFLLLTVLAVAANDKQVASETQPVSPPNQTPNTEFSGGQQVAAGSQAASMLVAQPQRLPKINIYINKNEIRKLLGKFIVCVST